MGQRLASARKLTHEAQVFQEKIVGLQSICTSWLAPHSLLAVREQRQWQEVSRRSISPLFRAKLGRLNVFLGGTPVLKDNHVYKIAASIPSVLLVSSSRIIGQSVACQRPLAVDRFPSPD